jgi:hypothetical protein
MRWFLWHLFLILLLSMLCGHAHAEGPDPVKGPDFGEDPPLAPITQAQARAGMVHAIDVRAQLGLGVGEIEMVYERQPDGSYQATPTRANRTLERNSDWRVRGFNRPVSMTCPATDTECKKKTKQMCEDAGHCGVKEGTAKVIVHADGSRTCAGDCSCNGAIAFVTCH